MTSKAPHKYCILLRDETGPTMSMDDWNGVSFDSEQAARAVVADVERRYPGFKVSVTESHVFNIDADDQGDADEGVVQRIARCPSELPEDLMAPIRVAADLWRDSSLRPRVAPAILALWNQLLDVWIADTTIPLIIRKSAGNRGQIVQHRTGRLIVPVDNTPAHWALGLALTGKCPSPEEIPMLFNEDALPIAMAFTKAERALATYTGKRAKWLGSLNKYGWKVCHIANVGLKNPAPLHVIDIRGLSTICRGLLDPSNMFLVPLKWAGVGELPDVIARFVPSQSGQGA
jgi:hypothetical protein